jgi:hypothetical protein
LDAKTTPQGVTIACEFTPGVCAGVVGAEVEWLLGYPEKALASIAGALALAERLAHPFTLSVALIYSSVVHLNRREPERALRQVAAVSRWINGSRYCSNPACCAARHCSNKAPSTKQSPALARA